MHYGEKTFLKSPPSLHDHFFIVNAQSRAEVDILAVGQSDGGVSHHRRHRRGGGEGEGEEVGASEVIRKETLGMEAAAARHPRSKA